MKRWKSLAALIAGAVAIAGLLLSSPPRVHAAPAPEVEYVYDVVVRRHYGFPDNDALGYGHGICDKVGRARATGKSWVRSRVTSPPTMSSRLIT